MWYRTWCFSLLHKLTNALGALKNIEIDLLQDNRNRDLKKMIKGMGANTTDKASEMASRAVGGSKQIVENLTTWYTLMATQHPTVMYLPVKMKKKFLVTSAV